MGRHYSHLNETERDVIYRLVVERRGSIAEAAKVLNRSRSTIYRELKRNGNSFNRYRHRDAHWQYRFRLLSKSRKGCKLHPEHQQYINELLKGYRFSAESITYFLLIKFSLRVSKETIYRYIIRDKQQFGSLYKYLPRFRRRKRRVKDTHRGFHAEIKKRRIEQRPLLCENRARYGDLEADLIIGSGKEVILTIADRKSRFLSAIKLPSKEKKHIQQGIVKCLKELNFSIKTITTDNGTEFFCFKELEKILNVKFYFTNPYHSWEKGLIENLNGFIRLYLKKRSAFENISNQTLKAITSIINLIPRDTLNRKSAFEVINKLNNSNRAKIIEGELKAIKKIFKQDKFDPIVGVA